MTDFNPGDRVTDGKRIGYVAQVLPMSDPYPIGVEFPDKSYWPFKPSQLRPAWQECLDCDGAGWDWDDASCCNHHAETVNCSTCDGAGRINRTGPYRLDNGEWSDGHDRRRRINIRSYPLPWEVWQFPADKTIWLVGNPRGLTTFPTHAEAINYATRMAQQGDK